jgi:hypothetical protein
MTDHPNAIRVARITPGMSIREAERQYTDLVRANLNQTEAVMVYAALYEGRTLTEAEARREVELRRLRSRKATDGDCYVRFVTEVLGRGPRVR